MNKLVLNNKTDNFLTHTAKEKGITLIALIVTIIILLILAGISINVIGGDNGIVTKSNEAKSLQEKREIIENANLEIIAKELLNNGTINQSEIEDILEKYGTVNKNDDGTIKSLTPENKDYEIPFDEIYNTELPNTDTEPTMAEIPEKSNNTAFDRTYGVIEIEFLEGTTYKTTEAPNVPNIGANMKKVYWEEDGTEKIEGTEGFDETKWYSYIAQTGDTVNGGTSKWANAVTLDTEGNITGYFVWIPRYAYRIVYFDTQEHEDAYRLTGTTDGIVGYSDARGFVDIEGKTPSNMEEPITSIAVGTKKLRPHPAFENGSTTGFTQGEWNTQLEGIWIAKYETSKTSDGIRVLSGKDSSIDHTELGTMYEYGLAFSTDNKSHMIKNSEWGAMAYLTESKYGRNGTQITPNTWASYTAGASGANVTNYPLQSTTGNYYGIYDVAGTCFEYVAGYIPDGSASAGNSFASTNPELQDATNDKIISTEYATVYKMVSSEATANENYNLNVNQKFGDALIETSTHVSDEAAWNSEWTVFFGYSGTKSPFMRRGGDYSIEPVGLFFYLSDDGYCGKYASTNSFRIALCVM